MNALFQKIAFIMPCCLSLMNTDSADASDPRLRNLTPWLGVACSGALNEEVPAYSGIISCSGNYNNSYVSAYASPGHITASSVAYRPYSGGSAYTRFTDYFIVDHSERNGQSGFLTADVSISAISGFDAVGLDRGDVGGVYDAGGLVSIMLSQAHTPGANIIKRYYDNITVGSTWIVDCTTGNNCRLTPKYTVIYDDRSKSAEYNIPLLNYNTVARLTMPVVFGRPIAFDARISVGAGGSGTYPRSIFGFYEVRWNGIVTVNDEIGNTISNYSIVSATGSDYRFALHSPDIPPIPEPQTWVMLLAGLGLVGLMARRRLTQH